MSDIIPAIAVSCRPMSTDAPPAPDLTCPLCGYNLRGLPEPRCPECGFRFTWDELRDEQRVRRIWLFEHPTPRPLRAFNSTFWRTCRPRRFWREVSPADAVRPRRLIAYGSLSVWPIALAAVLVAGTTSADVYRNNQKMRGMVAGWTPVMFDQYFPLPPSTGFFRQVGEQCGHAYPSPYRAIATVLAWPWLTLAALMLFPASMRRARIDRRHLLRVALYGCDFGLLMTTAVTAAVLVIPRWPGLLLWLDAAPVHGATPIATLVLACAAVGTYRLSIAYGRYLRFDRPFLTVLSAQAIVLLVVAVALVALASTPA